jgi:thioredoxin reductase (NADPH)
MSNNFSEVAIIGLGPAGMAAVNQFKRYYKVPRVFTRHEPGEFLKNAHMVQNYLGFSNGVAANTLIDQFAHTLLHLKDDIIYEEVMLVDYLNNKQVFLIKTDNTQYFTKYLIIATGTKAAPLNCNVSVNLRPYIYEEPHPLFSQKNNKIVIVGSGDAACVYALKLIERNQIHWFIRGKKLKAIPALKRAVKNSDVRYHTDREISDISEGVSSPLKLTFNAQYTIEADYLIPAVGREPALGFMAKKLKENLSKGVLKRQIYFAGDVQNDRYRQIAIAAGDGVKAAMQIYQSMADI